MTGFFFILEEKILSGDCAKLYNCPGYWRASGVSREIDLLTWKMKMRGPTVSYKDDPLKKQMFPQDDQPALKKTKTVNSVVHPEKY